MIANITSGNGTSGLINYHTEEEKKVSVIEIDNSITQDLNDFGKMLDYHNSKSIVKNPNIHVSLSPDASDQVSDSRLIEMAKEYMKEMGYENQPCAYVIHNDTNIKHVHCISSRIDINTAKKINDSHEQYRSQKITRDLEQKYNLKNVSSQKGERKVSEEFRVPVRKAKTDSFKANHIQKALNHIQNNYKTRTEQELKTLLRSYGIKEGRGQFWLLDKNDKVISKAIKANLDKEGIINPDLQKGNTKPVKDKIFEALKESGSMDEFKTRLHTQGVFVQEHRNNDGKVFGMSYVDDKAGRVWKSSELSKEFSFTKVNSHFESAGAKEKQETKSEIQQILDRVGERFKFKSAAELKTVLRTYGISEEEGQFYFIDMNETKISEAIKANLDKEGIINPDLQKGNTKPVKDKIFEALKESGSMDEFKTRLHTQGVFVQEHRNNDGKVFGMSYVDDKAGRVWKSSELSKELSFTKVNSHFESAGAKEKQETIISAPEPALNPTSVLNSLKGIGNIESEGGEEGINRKKKKKRKGLGM